MSARLRTIAALLLAAAVLAAAGSVVASTLACVLAHDPSLPWLDAWTSVTLAQQQAMGQLGLADLWEPHNEHRILVPRLLFLADFLWCSGRGRLPLAATWVVQAAHALLLVALVRKGGRRGVGVTLAATGVFVALAFSDLQIENLAEPFQVQFVLVYLAATAAFAALARARTHGGIFLAASLGAGAVATASMANGVAVWPLLVVLAAALGMGWRRVVLLALVGAAAVAVYLFGFAPAPPEGASTSPPGLVDVAVRGLCYLGGPFRRLLPSLPASAAAGAVALGLFVTFAASAARRSVEARRDPAAGRDPPSAAELVLLHVGLFVLGTAALTAFGRAGLPLVAMWAPRYSTPVLLLWSVLLALGLVRGGWRAGAAAVPAAALLLSATLQPQTHVPDPLWAHRLIGELALRCGVVDEHVRALAGPMFKPERPESFRGLVAFLREQRLSVFAKDDDDDLVGQSLHERFAVGPADLALGVIDHAQPVPGSGWGVACRGWAWSRADRAPPAAVLLTNGHGDVVGRALLLGVRRDVVAAQPEVKDPRVQWHGFASIDAADPTLVAHVVTAGGCASPFATLRVPVPDLVPLAEVGDDLGARVTSLNGSWGAGDPPGEAAGTFSPAVRTEAAGTAIAVLGPFLAPRSGTIAVPLRVGPQSWTATVYLVDASSGARLTALCPAPTPSGWALWRARLPARSAGRPVTLVAASSGKVAGAWLEVAPPRSVR